MGSGGGGADKHDAAGISAVAFSHHYDLLSADLKERNKVLSDENEQLKNYIDNLLVAIIEQSPEVLEIKNPTTTLAITSSVHGFTQ